MAYIKTDEKWYGDIADAIRYKLFITKKYLPSEMAEAIRSIGGDDTTRRTISVFDLVAWLLYNDFESSVIGRPSSARAVLESTFDLGALGYTYTSSATGEIAQE